MKHRIMHAWLALAGLSVAMSFVSPTAASGSSTNQPRGTHFSQFRPSFSRLLSWGGGRGQVGFRPTLPEFPAQGPSALAVAADGSVLILDRLNRRVVRLGTEGEISSPWVVASVPEDAEMVAAAAQSDLWMAFSPLRSKGWTYRAGKVLSSWSLPRVLPDIRSFSFRNGSVLVAHASNQERYVLGHLGATRSLREILLGKREGAFETLRGLRLAVRLRPDGRVQWWRFGSGAHAQAHASKLTFSFRALSARLLGVGKGTACMLVEQGGQQRTRVHVESSVVCAEVASGRVRMHVMLPEQGPYVPRDPVSFGPAAMRIVAMTTTDHGLEVRSWEVPAAEGQEVP